MISALLEENLHDVFCAVSRAPQEERAGDTGTGLIKEIAKHLNQFPAERQDDVARFLRDTDVVLELRHEIVHSVWPHSPTSGGLGWRSVPGRKRGVERDVRAWTQLRSDELPDVVRQLVDLQGRCREIVAWAQHPRSPLSG